MGLLVSFDPIQGNAVIERNGVEGLEANDDYWRGLVLLARAADFRSLRAPNRIEMAWTDFLEIVRDLEELRQRHGATIRYSEECSDRLRGWVQNRPFSLSAPSPN